MRNYHLHNPLDDSPSALPWPTDPPEAVLKPADVTRNRAKASMQTPAEPPLRDPGQQATHPFFQPHAPPVPSPPVPPRRARRKRGAPALSRRQARIDHRAAVSQPPAAPQRPSRPSWRLPRWTPHPARTKHPHHPPSRHTHRPSPKRTHSIKKARKSNSLSATTTRATGSGVRARSSTASRTWARTVGCKPG